MNRFRAWVEKWGAKNWDQETIDRFLFYHEHKSRLRPEEIERFPKWMREASEEYRIRITDPCLSLRSQHPLSEGLLYPLYGEGLQADAGRRA